jgi:hypothetical protein
MSKPRVPQNLPPESQQWVRDIERRLNDLEVARMRTAGNAAQANAAAQGSRFAGSGAVVRAGEQFFVDNGGTSTGTFNLNFPRPPWAQGAAMLVTATVQASDESGGPSWEMTLYNDVVTVASGTPTTLITDLNRMLTFVGVGGVGYVNDSTSNAFDTGTLPTGVDTLRIVGRWGRINMPPILANGLWRSSAIVFWY